ncbi:hypothetical protein BJ508DRAFT_379457 [Ascobolus immersus RN42]|uniref:Uncharacterized protein n=1 Tax=Ascobolus immersus RN42 TaxID=1160509 RepID=A0A3N4HV90_ASCIM|nr:hypothetical protein BJ508DRAFT_379457 [Ascobolus immersus RN42]
MDIAMFKATKLWRMADFVGAIQFMDSIDLVQLHPNHMTRESAESMPYTTYLKRFYVSGYKDSISEQIGSYICDNIPCFQQMDCFVAVANHLIEAAKLPPTATYDIHSSAFQHRLTAKLSDQSSRDKYSDFTIFKLRAVPKGNCKALYDEFFKKPFAEYTYTAGRTYIQGILSPLTSSSLLKYAGRPLYDTSEIESPNPLESFRMRLSLGLAREEQLHCIHLWFERMISELKDFLLLWVDLLENNDESRNMEYRERAERNLFLRILKQSKSLDKIGDESKKHFVPMLHFLFRIRSAGVN